MLGTRFYHGLIRKYTAVFGTLFKEVHLIREGTDVEQVLRLPFVYARKEKMSSSILQNSDLNRDSAVDLPRLSFELDGFSYNPQRQLMPTASRAARSGNANNLFRQYTPVPYDFHFLLHLYVRNEEDGLKVMEQILPHFTPALTLEAELIPEMDDVRNLTIILEPGIEKVDTYEGKVGDVRMITYTLRFTLQGFLFGPVRDRPAIKVSMATVYATSNTAQAANSDGIRITVTPGMDANGNPTSNSSLTVAYSEIFVDDDWTHVVVREQDFV